MSVRTVLGFTEAANDEQVVIPSPGPLPPRCFVTPLVRAGTVRLFRKEKQNRGNNEGRAPRPVVIDGIRYDSLTAACAALKVGYTRLYYLLGERVRFKK